ncbi:hypothetical protein [Thermococcus sp. 21S7]|uniref:hypothetical protein n=1 Tax=Thermococcus sp. 21S7 TaxID=1638221 RepID=UPI00143AAC99|nr:hypothetical protein [Thermococcus sp. 21S7]NJE60534.1 hypothetical protein [Thermococcus sp. 21S7]
MSSMDELNTKTIRLTLDAYKILNSEKKKLNQIANVSYTYSDIILASLAMLEALNNENRPLVIDILRKFKNARVNSDKTNIEELFKNTVNEIVSELSSNLLKEAITKIIEHLIERGFPGAAMEVLLSNVNLFDAHERNQLSFEILAAIGENQKLKELL